MAEELKDYVEQTTAWAEALMEELDWSRDEVMKADDAKQCAFNKGHMVPKDKLQHHEDMCRLVAAGYTRDELEKEQSSSFYYEKSNTVIPIHIDDRTMCNLLGRKSPSDLPRTVARSTEELTPAEKKRIYDYCRDCCKAISDKHKLSEHELMLLAAGPQVKTAEPKSHLQTLADLRDLKRRRQSYKGKSTHTAGKSHKEVLRDVITQQMKILEENSKLEQENARSKSPDQSQSSRRHSRDRSRSRERSRSPDRSRDRSRSRSRSTEKSKKNKKGKKHKKDRKNKHKKRDRSRSREKSNDA